MSQPEFVVLVLPMVDQVILWIDRSISDFFFLLSLSLSSCCDAWIEKNLLSLIYSLQNCYIDICSPEVLSIFTDNFYYQHWQHHFIKGLLVDDVCFAHFCELLWIISGEWIYVCMGNTCTQIPTYALWYPYALISICI